MKRICFIFLNYSFKYLTFLLYKLQSCRIKENRSKRLESLLSANAELILLSRITPTLTLLL